MQRRSAVSARRNQSRHCEKAPELLPMVCRGDRSTPALPNLVSISIALPPTRPLGKRPHLGPLSRPWSLSSGPNAKPPLRFQSARGRCENRAGSVALSPTSARRRNRRSHQQLRATTNMQNPGGFHTCPVQAQGRIPAASSRRASRPCQPASTAGQRA
jgi:hypothetical protein